MYELKPDTNTWSPALSTLQDGDTVITLNAQSSSVLATFKWESYEAGQPLLVLVVTDPETGDPDFENINGQNIDITGINVQPLPMMKKITRKKIGNTKKKMIIDLSRQILVGE